MSFPYQPDGPLVPTQPLPAIRPIDWEMLRWSCPAFNEVWAAGGFQTSTPSVTPGQDQSFMAGTLIMGPTGDTLYVVVQDGYIPSADFQQDILEGKVRQVNPVNMIYMQYIGGKAYLAGDVLTDSQFLYYATQDFESSGDFAADIAAGLIDRVKPTFMCHYPYAAGDIYASGDLVIAADSLVIYYVLNTYPASGDPDTDVSNGDILQITGISMNWLPIE